MINNIFCISLLVGLGCSTVLSPEAAALAAAQMLALHDNIIWARLRAEQCNTWVKLRLADGDIVNSCC